MKIFVFFLAFLAFFSSIACVIWILAANKKAAEKRATFIRSYTFPFALRDKLRGKYPQLDGDQLDQVMQALKQYFLICHEAGAAGGRSSVGMPSKVVDEAWHEFILMSREYSEFCNTAFGRYLHHTPESQMNVTLEKPLVNALHQVRTKSGGAAGWAMLGSIPLLFAIDKAFAIPDGFYYDEAAINVLEQKRQTLFSGSGISSSDTSSMSNFNGSDTHCGPTGASCGDAGASSSGSGGSSCSGGGGCGGGSS
jgi:hypothetical protein